MVAKSRPAQEANRKADGSSRSVKLYLSKIEPLALEVLPHIYRFCDVFYEYYVKYVVVYIHPYWEILFPIMLLFFGGQFSLTIMTYQAFKLAGWSTMKMNYQRMKESYNESMQSLKEDKDACEIFDRDGDGNVTMCELFKILREAMTSTDAAKRERAMKGLLLAAKCVDANRIMDACVGFWAGIVAVIATLKSRIAQNISIGANIGSMISVYARSYAEKPLYEAYPEYKSWVDAGLQSICTGVGVLTSLLLTRVVAAFNCALQGAQSLSGAIVELLEKRGYTSDTRSRDSALQGITALLVFLGLAWQVSTGFGYPWYLEPIFFPFLVCEYILTCVAMM